MRRLFTLLGMGLLLLAGCSETLQNEEVSDKTPESFCGVALGGPVDASVPSDIGSERIVRNGTTNLLKFVTARLASRGTWFGFDGSPTVRATLKGGKVYEVRLVKDLRNVPGPVEKGRQYEASLAELRRQFVVRDRAERLFGGDYLHTFFLGHVLVTYQYVTEGSFSKGSLVLKAVNRTLLKEAEAEGLVPLPSP